MRATLFSALVCGCTQAPEDHGEGTIAGEVSGTSFEVVGASFRAGAPDDPERSIVVYVFDTTLACDELGSPGWDARIGDEIQSLELKLIGKTPGVYPVVSAAIPGMGQASVNYTLASTLTTPMEISAIGGMVTLTEVGDADAQGEFDLMFPNGESLQGSFVAAACPGGREP